MKKEIIEYLESIGLTGPLLTRVETAYNFYTKYVGVNIEDAFVSEFVNKDGSRVYESLWFFNAKSSFEVTAFMTDEDYDSDILNKAVNTYRIKLTFFDIISNISNDNSRMTLDFGFKYDRVGSMKASKDNCKQLSMIFKKYILPNYATELV